MVSYAFENACTTALRSALKTLWQSAWRNQTLPWIVFGLLSFTAGTLWSRIYKGTGQVVGAGPEVDTVFEPERGNANGLPSEPETQSPDRKGV